MRFRARGRTNGRKTGMNRTEAEHGAGLAARKQVGLIREYSFERVTLKLADDTRYTPEFMVMMPDGLSEFHEVKGGAGFEDDALVKIKVAAEMFPQFVFRSFTKKAKKHGGGWAEREF